MSLDQRRTYEGINNDDNRSLHRIDLTIIHASIDYNVNPRMRRFYSPEALILEIKLKDAIRKHNAYQII